jgi:hypothetical protein
VLTENGYKKAKDIEIGENLITANFDTMPIGDLNCSLGYVSDKCTDIVSEWNSEGLHNVTFNLSKLTDIKTDLKTKTIYFNEDSSKELSLSEVILINRNDKFTFKCVSEIEVGDIIIASPAAHTDFEDLLVESITVVEKETKTYLFYRDPFGLLIVDGMLAYNGCPTQLL